MLDNGKCFGKERVDQGDWERIVVCMYMCVEIKSGSE